MCAALTNIRLFLFATSFHSVDLQVFDPHTESRLDLCALTPQRYTLDGDTAIYIKYTREKRRRAH